MSRRIRIVAGMFAVAVALPVVGYQESKTSAPPVAPATAVVDDDVLTALDKRVRFEDVPANLPLREILDNLTKQLAVQFIVNEELFKSQGMDGLLDRKPNVNQRLSGLRASQFMKIVLEGCSSGFIVRPDYIEIVPLQTVRNLFVPQAVTTDDGLFVRSDLPVVNIRFRQTELEEAVRQLADANAMTVVFSAKIPNEARATKVTERLLNLPFDTAVELLAAKADLVVVRKDTAFTVVTRTERPEKPKAVPADPGRDRAALAVR